MHAYRADAVCTAQMGLCVATPGPRSFLVQGPCFLDQASVPAAAFGDSYAKVASCATLSANAHLSFIRGDHNDLSPLHQKML